MLRYSQHSERAVLSLLASKEVVFLQVSVSRGILSVLLADVVSSHRDAESSGMQLKSLGKERHILILSVDLIGMVGTLLLCLNSHFEVVIYAL